MDVRGVLHSTHILHVLVRIRRMLTLSHVGLWRSGATVTTFQAFELISNALVDNHDQHIRQYMGPTLIPLSLGALRHPHASVARQASEFREFWSVAIPNPNPFGRTV
jgi:hypothetical protein